jgi:hypothetical protein
MKLVVSAQAGGLIDGEAARQGGDFDSGRLQFPLAANRFVWLRHNADDVVARRNQPFQAWHGEGRRSHKEDSHRIRFIRAATRESK